MARRGIPVAILVCAFACLVACSASAPVPPRPPESIEVPLEGTYPLSSVVISLNRLGDCEGMCATYLAELHGDGRVQYHGYGFVAEAGRREARIDPQEIAHLLELLYAIDFFATANDLRPANYSYSNSALISVRIGDYEKRVIMSGWGSDELAALPRTIYELADLDKWVNVSIPL